MNVQASVKKQLGAATLLTALMLLIGTTLIALLSSKTVIVSTQIAADNVRMSKAVAAANAAMDFAVGYFNGSQYISGACTKSGTSVPGFDHNNDGVVDTLPASCLSYADGTHATVIFENTDIDAAGNDNPCVLATTTPNWRQGRITARGFSDDSLAQRTVTQCVGGGDILSPTNAPKQSLITHGAVGLTGNYTVVNRFYNTSVWSGHPMNTWGSAQTYLRANGTLESQFTKDQLQDDDVTNAYTSPPVTEWANNATTKGLGVDVIASDPRLGALTGDEFFESFIDRTRQEVYQLALANGQVYSSFPSDSQASGVVWIGPAPGQPLGNFSVNGGTYGSHDTNTTLGNPVRLIVNGNLTVHGNLEVNGMLYVVGTMDANGTPTVYGSVVVEDPAGVTGNGTVNLIYSPYTLDRASNPIQGTTTVVSGTWRDW